MGGRSVSFAPAIVFDQTIEEAFPKVDSGIKPFGSRVLVQIRAPKNKTKGGIILTDETRDTVNWNTQVGLVRAVGPIAFCNRDTQKPWPEGSWCGPGEYVRIPKHGGDRWEVPLPSGDGVALFALFNDLDILGAVTGNPLDVIAFV